jgi:hypothetical protein
MMADAARFQVTHWVLVCAAVATAAALGRPSPTSVLLGGGAIGVLTWLNATAFRSVVVRQRRSLAMALLSAKVAAFLGLGWLAFAARAEYRPDPVGFALGISCLPAAAVVEALRVRKG